MTQTATRTPIDEAIEAAAERARSESAVAGVQVAYEETRPRAWVRPLVWGMAGLVIACGWDRAVWLMVSSGGGAGGHAKFEWLEMSMPWALVFTPLYYVGQLLVWVVVALAMVMSTWLKPDTARVMVGVRRGVFILLAALLGGGFAEGLKILSRRLRPEANDGLYAFKPFDGEWWNTSGLGLASSHAGVAIAGAVAIGLILPRLRWAAGLVAIACALGRVVVGAHYLSDVYVGAGCGVLAVWVVYKLDARNNHRVGIDGRIVASRGTRRTLAA